MKILVVDDDNAMTELLKIILQPVNFEVITANSGSEGIQLADSQVPDVIILDLMMPEVNGLEVCHAVRKFSQVPIIILSAMDNPLMVAECLDAGADDYLIKPVASSVLIAHINKAARRSNGQHVLSFQAAG
jgi:DNA-binding response OmpR family regulator